MNEDLAPLRSFVLPGGSRLDAELHIARTFAAGRSATASCSSNGERAAGSHPVSESVERRAVCVEPVGRP